MELTNSQLDFIHIALEAHIEALNNELRVVNEPLVTETIQARIDGILPVLEALESGDYTLILEEY
jgi:hypothetical protein|nr:MAG TPA: hypothetical protein [Caudoviricetes sp.]